MSCHLHGEKPNKFIQVGASQQEFNHGTGMAVADRRQSLFFEYCVALEHTYYQLAGVDPLVS